VHVHNALHHLTELQAGYRAALGEMDEQFSGIERAGETLLPTLDLWGLPEWAILRGEQLALGRLSVAALAGNFSMVQVENETSDRLTVIERGTRFFASGGSVLILSITTTQLANTRGRCFVRDGRNVRPTVPGTNRRDEQAAAVPAGVSNGDAFLLPATSGQPLDFEVVLDPGFTLVARPDAQNIAVHAAIVARSRRATGDELRNR
jgi:hypothetical protein